MSVIYTTATTMPDLTHVCDLHHSSWQRQILNPLSKARDRTRVLLESSWVLNLLSHNGNALDLGGQGMLVAFRNSQTRD